MAGLLRLLGHWLGHAWAAPAALVGLLLALCLWRRSQRWQRRQGTLEIDLGFAERASARYGAITFGQVIVGRNATQLTLLRAHEQVHVRQYRRWGLLFFPAYALSSLWQWLHGRDPYRDNAFEREAYRLAPTRGKTLKSL